MDIKDFECQIVLTDPFVVFSFIYNVKLLFSRWVISDSLPPHELQHTKLPCPSLPPRVCSNSCPLSHWCHPTISSSVAPFSSCLQSFPASGPFPMSWIFASGGPTIGASASASVLPANIQGWFPLGRTDLISLLSKGPLQCHNWLKINWINKNIKEKKTKTNKEKYLELCFPTSSATPFLRGTFTFRLKVPKPSLQGQERGACSFLLLGSRWKLRLADPPLATESGRPGGVLSPGRSQAGLPCPTARVSAEPTAERREEPRAGPAEPGSPRGRSRGPLLWKEWGLLCAETRGRRGVQRSKRLKPKSRGCWQRGACCETVRWTLINPGHFPHPRLLPAWPGNFSVTRRADSPEGWARQAAGGPGRGFLHFQRGSERLTVLRSGSSALVWWQMGSAGLVGVGGERMARRDPAGGGAEGPEYRRAALEPQWVTRGWKGGQWEAHLRNTPGFFF